MPALRFSLSFSFWVINVLPAKLTHKNSGRLPAAGRWIEAWNARESSAIMPRHAGDIKFRSKAAERRWRGSLRFDFHAILFDAFYYPMLRAIRFLSDRNGESATHDR